MLPGLGQFAGVGGGVDGFKQANADLRIDLRGGELGVAEHGLNHANVGSVFQHQGGHGVAEQVTAAVFADVGAVDGVAHQLRQSIGCKGLAQMGEKQVELHGVAACR